MTPTSYNISIGVGVALSAIGAGAQWGWPAGVMAAGLLVLLMTMLGVSMLARVR